MLKIPITESLFRMNVNLKGRRFWAQPRRNGGPLMFLHNYMKTQFSWLLFTNFIDTRHYFEQRFVVNYIVFS